MENDLKRVLEHGPWAIGSRPLILREWTPSFIMEKEQFATVPVWIKLPHLPLICWNNKILSAIGSVIGKPIRMDDPTFRRSRLAFAHLCVEVEIGSDFADSVELYREDGSVYRQDRQEIIYEWKPMRCTLCFSINHSNSACLGVKKNMAKKGKWRQKYGCCYEGWKSVFDGFRP